MAINSHQRLRTAVKRSVHFVLTDDFSDSLKNSEGGGVVSTFTREFWRFLDDSAKNQTVRKNLREKLWNVWRNVGEDTLSVPFTQGTYLIVDKRGPEFSLSLKETSGELTEINDVRSEGPIGEDETSPESKKVFEDLWKKIIFYNGTYPSHFRPVVAAVAQMVAARTNAPLPVVCAGITDKFMPSELSNGYLELAKHSMPDEVFDQTLVDRAIANNVAERVGPANAFTFKVKKGKYQEWKSMVSASRWKNVPIESQSSQLNQPKEIIEEREETEEEIEEL